ncbi:hypothetical protein, partial [Methylobacterium nigriterrae]|uniref:hypothetical protein n=1 Tax=Methylobacterium nigriterrae TaxID=3127512 RepID=UPI0030136AB0
MRALLIGVLGALIAAASTAASPSHRAKPVPGQDKALDLAFRIIREHRLLPKDYLRCFSLTLDSKDARKIAEFTARES